jgi:uncharacterized protein (DUF2141 family)
MKILVKSCLITLILMNLNCANQRSPTGGPKDSIPPILISSIPPNGALNFDNDWIELSFDDDINTTTLKKNLVISPLTELKYTAKTKKNKVRIEFEEHLLDSTTYTFNFLQGITDLTEKNPVINLSLALSTGPYIDSLFIKGTVHELYTQLPAPGVLVGLYSYSDSLDLTIDKPLYFSTTNESGTYAINNIKYGRYKIFAFNDENSNFTFNSENEAYGLKSSFILLSSGLDSVNLIINSIDSRPLKFISARPFGRYYDVRYSKPITFYQLTYMPPYRYTFHHQLQNEFTSIRIFPPLDTLYNRNSDSSQLVMTVNDTINQQSLDTLMVKFLSSQRPPTPPTSNIRSQTINASQYKVSLSFDKPIVLFDSLSVLLNADTLLPVTPIDVERYHWNYNKTELSFKVSMNWSLLQDSLNYRLQKLHKQDSLIPDHRMLNLATIAFDSTCFTDADGLSLPPILIELAKNETSDFGTLHIKANTAKTSFIIQILDTENKLIAERRNQTNFTVEYLSPGTYKIRVLIDNNLDGIWSVGNFMDDSTPENIYLYPKTTKISANWEISIDDLTF